MKPNTYLEAMEHSLKEWSTRRDAHDARKQQIINEHGWGSPEFEAWQEQREPCPYPAGACKALIAWKDSLGDELLLRDFLWEGEAQDFVETLRKAGLEQFVITTRSSALMENLHWFAEQGCRIDSLCKVTRVDRWGDEETLMGIRMNL